MRRIIIVTMIIVVVLLASCASRNFQSPANSNGFSYTSPLLIIENDSLQTIYLVGKDYAGSSYRLLVVGPRNNNVISLANFKKFSYVYLENEGPPIDIEYLFLDDEGKRVKRNGFFVVPHQRIDIFVCHTWEPAG